MPVLTCSCVPCAMIRPPTPLPPRPRNALNPFNFTTTARMKRDETRTDDCLIYVWLSPQWSMSGREGFVECVSAGGGWIKLKSRNSPGLRRDSDWNDTEWRTVDRKGGKDRIFAESLIAHIRPGVWLPASMDAVAALYFISFHSTLI